MNKELEDAIKDKKRISEELEMCFNALLDRVIKECKHTIILQVSDDKQYFTTFVQGRYCKECGFMEYGHGDYEGGYKVLNMTPDREKFKVDKLDMKKYVITKSTMPIYYSNFNR